MAAATSRPRIAVFTKALDNWRSGSGHHLQEILSAALDLNEDRFDFTFVHYQPGRQAIYRRVREMVVPRNPLRASARLRKERFDIVHYAPLTIYSPLWGVRARKVATIHGAEQFLVPQYYGLVELAHEHIVVPPYARRMDRIVTVSETSARFFVQHFRVRPERIVICPNGLSPVFRSLPPAEVSAPDRLGIPRPFVLHVSRFSERKNPWVLLDSFSRLSRDPALPHRLVCVGGGWDDARVLSRVRELGIEHRFHAPGFLPEPEVAQLMNSASVFVFPSLAEGFGMPNIEAMACGCPVVTTPGFAIREIVGDAALVVEDPMDAAAIAAALRRVLTDSSLRSDLIARGRERSRRFSWQESAQRLLATYEELLEKEPSRG